MTTSSRQYDDTFLVCRDLRHQWELIGFYRQDGAIRRVIQCSRCTTQRTDKWHSDGEREPSFYSYVEGYQVEGGFDTYAVRREVIRRATIFKSVDEMLASVGKVRRSR